MTQTAPALRPSTLDGFRARLLTELGSSRELQAHFEQERLTNNLSRRDAGTDEREDPESSSLAYEEASAAAMVTRVRARIEETQAALDRIDAGTYGSCEVCSHPIGHARLTARPFATTCIECARG